MCVMVLVFLFLENPDLIEKLFDEGRGQPLLETSTGKINLTSIGTKHHNSVRQDVISQEIQVVQDLNESPEDSASSGSLTGLGSVLGSGSGSLPSSTSESTENDLSPSIDVTKPIESNEVLKPTTDKPINENDPNPINKFCSCSSASCKCCRDFTIPLVPIRGPGCATVRYLDNDRLSIGIKYGDFVLASRTVDSRRPSPICLPLPGGYNRFCGRIYGKYSKWRKINIIFMKSSDRKIIKFAFKGISRKDDNFKACLGLELRADDDIEASLRVSCFQFGPKGLATMEAEPLPPNIGK